MRIQDIWKVKASDTQSFQNEMLQCKKQFLITEVMLNTCAGYNYFYEAPDCYGNISEERAQQYSDELQMEISEYADNEN